MLRKYDLNNASQVIIYHVYMTILVIINKTTAAIGCLENRVLKIILLNFS